MASTTTAATTAEDATPPVKRWIRRDVLPAFDMTRVRLLEETPNNIADSGQAPRFASERYSAMPEVLDGKAVTSQAREHHWQNVTSIAAKLPQFFGLNSSLLLYSMILEPIDDDILVL